VVPANPPVVKSGAGGLRGPAPAQPPRAGQSVPWLREPDIDLRGRRKIRDGIAWWRNAWAFRWRKRKP